MAWRASPPASWLNSSLVVNEFVERRPWSLGTFEDCLDAMCATQEQGYATEREDSAKDGEVSEDYACTSRLDADLLNRH